MLKYTPRGLNIVSAILNKGTKFCVYYDPDIDGLISGYLVTIILRFFKLENIWFINGDRKHGFLMTDEEIDQIKGYTLIAVDFYIAPCVLERLADSGISVINIDHHDITETELFHYTSKVTECEAVIINNQYCFEPENQRYLSGAGVVYYVFSAFFPELVETQRNQALVGISLLTDIREIENDGAAAFLYQLYTWSDDFTRYLIDLTKGEKSYGFGEQTVLDRSFVDFVFAPKFNALFRFNKGIEAIKLFHKQLSGVDLNYYVTTQKSITNSLESIMQKTVLSNFVLASVDIKDLESLDCEYTASSFIGLLCSKVKDKEGKTTLAIVTDGDKIIRGSVRGKYNLDYLTLFRSQGLDCAGHKNACGVKPCVVKGLNAGTLNNLVIALETNKIINKEELSQIIPTLNLGVQLRCDKGTPIYNTYVRSDRRRLFDCSKCDFTVAFESMNKSFIEYSISGVSVKCFDKELNPKNGGLVMAIINKGYVECYLEKGNV